MSVKFGTSGLRGLSVDLLGEPSSLYSAAFCRHLLDTGQAEKGAPILVGQDYRESSPAIAASCMGAIAASGFTPVDCGALPTPALAFFGQKRNAASIMITGSHIPADRNGIKFYRADGEITKDDEQAISAWAEKLKGTVSTGDAEGEDMASEALALFGARCTSILPEDALSGMKIGVYQHSTVARDLFIAVLEHYGADVVPLGFSENFIPVDTEAVSQDTVDLLEGWAKEHGLDALVSADGDADRPLVADETGTPLRGDLVGLMTANFLKAKVVVTPVTSNSGIEKNGDFEVVRTRVGSPFVIAGMMEALSEGNDGVMGFEANGGLLTASPFRPADDTIAALPTRDCFLPILSALYLAAKDKRAMSKLASAYSLPVADADRIKDFAQERSAALMAFLRERDENLSAFLEPVGTVAGRSDIDGLRVTLDDGRIIHFRPSGNAPEMRCYVEAETAEAARDLLKQGLSLIEGFKAD
ncbi:phosphomannomutase [Martelella radicis]|uniref:Phosphomannomutase n=1 Tax=Martelella radicis TaxID=1397476 RepID=A0A7W6KKE4_9HYPH|nr:phosphomannomutase [Martelella radicis]MBB4122881.1 phosphomannomutase [Martelella radicis]